jgi:RNA polymerase sigma factor (sigma-70 family)
MKQVRAGVILEHVRKLVPEPNADDVTDAELLQRFAVGREQAPFSTLLSRHGPMLLRACRRLLHNPQDAEDICQATFLVLASKASASYWHASVAGWLHRVAYQLAVKANAAAARRAVHERKMVGRSTPDLLDSITGRELQSALDEELARLPEKVRTPLILCYLEGATRDEAARQLGWPLGTLKSRVERGRELLRVRLTSRGLTLSVALSAGLLGDRTAQAALPAEFATVTAQAAQRLVACSMTTGAAGIDTARRLAREMLRTMFLSKVKTAGAWLLGVCVLTAGAGLAAYHGLLSGQSEERPNGQPPLMAQDYRGAAPGADLPQRADSYGDPLPRNAIARLGTTRFRHEGEAGSLAFSPDGKILAARSQDGTIVLWDAPTGKELQRFRGPPGLLDSGSLIAFSPDSRILAAPADASHVSLWEVAKGKPVRSFALPEVKGVRGGDDLHTIRFSNDGKLLAVGGTNSTYVLDVTGGQPLHHFKENIGGFTFAPDGRSLILQVIDLPRGKNDLQMWSVQTKKVFRHHEIPVGLGHQKGRSEELICDIAFSPDGTIVATSGTDRIILWAAATFEVRTLIEAKMGQVKNLAFTPDGRSLVSGSESDGKVHVWDASTGKELRQFDGRLGTLRSMALSPDGRMLAAGGVHNTIRLWNLPTGQERFTEQQGHDAQVNSVSYSPDGSLLASGGENGQVWIWHTATGKPLRQIRGTTPRQVAFSPDGKRLALLSPGMYFWGKFIDIYDAATGNKLFRLDHGDVKEVSAVAFSANGKTIVSTDWKDSGVKGSGGICGLSVWETSTGQRLRHLSVAGFYPRCLALSPDGMSAAVGGGSEPNQGLIRLWDLQREREVLAYPVPGHVITSLAFSPDGRMLVSAGSDRAVRLWEVVTGKQIFVRKEHSGAGYVVAFSSDGRIVASGSGAGVHENPLQEQDSIELWDVATGKEVQRLQGHRSSVTSLAFAPDGSRLASGLRNSAVMVWDVPRARRVQQLEPPQLGPKELEGLWTDLAGEDAQKAHRAVWALAEAPRQSLPFIKERLRPRPQPDMDRIGRWIADLDSGSFTLRKKASTELEKMRAWTEPALRKTLAGSPSLEVRQRVGQLLEKLKTPTSEELLAIRAIEVLEHIDTPEAAQVLRTLASGDTAARLMQEAEAASALARLTKTPHTSR